MLLQRGSFSYTNDENGNTLTGAGRTMSWDSQNRMIACNVGSNTSTFTYGSDGLRRRMVTGGKTVDYLLDGQNVARELTTQNGVQTTTATYLNGPRGPEYRRDQNGVVEWNVFDGLGSVVATVGFEAPVPAERARFQTAVFAPNSPGPGYS